MKVLSDNTTALYGLNNLDSSKSMLCDQEVRRIWSWAIEEIFITAVHIPGILNEEADRPRTKKIRIKNRMKAT